MSRREQIRMSDGEVASFLADQRTVTCATIGPRGWPHLMPLWYVLRDADGAEGCPRLWAWTYAVSQKVRNLERDARATLQVETGESYEQLRGVMLECEVAIHRELGDVRALGREIFARYAVPRGRAAGAGAAGRGRRDGRPAGRQAGGARVRRAAPGELGSPQAGRRLLVPQRPPCAFPRRRGGSSRP